jgi:hypothetical protein
MKCTECGQERPVDKLEEAGKLAAVEAVRMWELDVFDPPIGSAHDRAGFCLSVIEQIIKANGWSWVLPYKGNGQPQWCGMFDGACWRAAGLDPAWLASYFASTYRLHLWATYQKFDRKSKANPRPSEGPRLCVDLSRGLPEGVTPRAGDIVIVGDGDPRVGDHATLLIAYDERDGTFDTISGNGGGYGPKGNKREGISRKEYVRTDALGKYRAMWLIRPAVGDLL